VNYLEHTKAVNTGQITQYYVENNHPAIIDRDTWEQVQIEMKRRDKLGAHYSSSDVFASKLICEDCGSFYGKKKWHTNTKYERFIYQCNSKFHKGKDKCKTPHLKEEDIKQKFIQSYNILMADKDRIIQDVKAVIKLLTETTDIDSELTRLDDEFEVVSKMVNKLVKENSKTRISFDDYNRKYEELQNRHEELKIKRNDLINTKLNKESQALKMRTYLNSITQAEDELDQWNESIWMLMVESAVVHRDSSITFRYKNSEEIEVR
jgi:vacuolar-type H+-ATPase subunit D/Vma8